MNDTKVLLPMNWRVVLGRLLLLGVLVQVLLFFSGLMLPVQRVMTLWGRSVEERRKRVEQPWLAFKSYADKFPEDARIYFIYPEQHVHDVVNYYFYPRFVTVSMTNSAYRIQEEYDRWDEMPDEQWLISNRFTYVLSFKKDQPQGWRAHAWKVQPGVRREIAEWERTHVNK